MKFSQIEVSSIRFGKLEDNIRTPSQNIAFIYYQDDRTRLNAIIPEFITETYGIRRGGPYYQTDRSRAFFNMPFLSEFKKHEGEIYYAEIEACYNKLREIDDFFGSREIRLQRTTSDRPTPNSNWSWHTTTTLRALRSLRRKTVSERRSR